MHHDDFPLQIHDILTHHGKHIRPLLEIYEKLRSPLSLPQWLESFLGYFSIVSALRVIKEALSDLKLNISLLLSVEACSTWKWKSESCSGLINESTEEAGLNDNNVEARNKFQHRVARFTTSWEAPELHSIWPKGQTSPVKISHFQRKFLPKH